MTLRYFLGATGIGLHATITLGPTQHTLATGFNTFVRLDTTSPRVRFREVSALETYTCPLSVREVSA